MRLAALVLPALLVACSEEEPDARDTAPSREDTDTGADTDSADTASDTDTGDDVSILEDVRGRMQENAEGCEDFNGTALAGAARYFWGEYRGDVASGWTGEEAVFLYANEAWRALGGEDCVGYWTVTAGFGGTGECPTCDLGLSVTATYDAVNSTCPEDLWGGDFTSAYAVDRSSDGVATWYYTASAERFGVGVWNDAIGMNFLSERACVWF